MALSAPALLTENTDTSNLSAGGEYTTGSFTPTADAILYIAVITKGETATSPTISGHSLTWSLIDSVNFNTGASPTDQLLVFRAQGSSSPGAGTITITVGGTTTGCSWKVWEQTGHDTTDPIGQFDANTGDASSAVSATLAEGAETSYTLMAVCNDVGGGADITFETNWVEIGDRVVGSTPGSTLYAGYFAGPDATPTATLSDPLDWGAIAFEVVAAESGVGTFEPQQDVLQMTGLAGLMGFAILMPDEE
jgi:hypothetical protein